MILASMFDMNAAGAEAVFEITVVADTSERSSVTHGNFQMAPRVCKHFS